MEAGGKPFKISKSSELVAPSFSNAGAYRVRGGRRLDRNDRTADELGFAFGGGTSWISGVGSRGSGFGVIKAVLEGGWSGSGLIS